MLFDLKMIKAESAARYANTDTKQTHTRAQMHTHCFYNSLKNFLHLSCLDFAQSEGLLHITHSLCASTWYFFIFNQIFASRSSCYTVYLITFQMPILLLSLWLIWFIGLLDHVPVNDVMGEKQSVKPHVALVKHRRSKAGLATCWTHAHAHFMSVRLTHTQWSLQKVRFVYWMCRILKFTDMHIHVETQHLAVLIIVGTWKGRNNRKKFHFLIIKFQKSSSKECDHQCT